MFNLELNDEELNLVKAIFTSDLALPVKVAGVASSIQKKLFAEEVKSTGLIEVKKTRPIT